MELLSTAHVYTHTHIMHNITETYPQIDDRLGLTKYITYIMLAHRLYVTVFMN